MTVTELLKTFRREELRTNRLVNNTTVGAYLSHFKGRGMDFAHFKPLEIERFGNYGEFAIIKKLAGKPIPFLIPSNLMGLKNSRHPHLTQPAV